MAIRHVQAKVVSAVNRLAWHSSVQRRTTRVSRLVRLLPWCVLSSDARRSKTARGWVVTVATCSDSRVVVLEIGSRTAGSTLHELNASIRVRIHRPDLIDLLRLERVISAGGATLEFVATPA